MFINLPIDILYQDENLVAIDKPSGYHVHPHESEQYKISRDLICLYLLRNKMKKWVYPVHRLDVSTSGVLLFALNPEAASKICDLFARQQTKKTYKAVVRGHPLNEGIITHDLKSDSSGDMLAAQTVYKCLAKIELPFSVEKKHASSRYSLIEVKPLTGRFHQIRRHFNRISHPLIGDSSHGDSRHNIIFREKLEIPGLCLRAESLEFTHPWTQEQLKITAPDVLNTDILNTNILNEISKEDLTHVSHNKLNDSLNNNLKTTNILENKVHTHHIQWQKIYELFNYFPDSSAAISSAAP